MLYQTHHNPFFSSSILVPSLSLSAASFQSPLLSSSFVKEMERIETAMKSSSRKDVAMKLSPPAFFDDLLAVSAQNGVSTDDFSIDDLLDLPNDDVLDEEEPLKMEGPPQQRERSSVSEEEPHDDENTLRRSTDFSAGEEFGSLPASELSVPADDLADLEWLSHFVEDSFSEYSVPYLTAEKPAWLTGNQKQQVVPVNDESCFKTPVPAKARTKRARTGSRVWSLGSPSFTDSSSSSTSSSSSSTPSSPWLAGSELLEPVEKSVPIKKPKRKPAVSGHQQQPRRCSHCGVQKTPQWRAGPMGAKTLCNACGVRYKSGRLLPEYRPACSPTFSSELHSNSHRKVLEMRRKKEMLDQVEPGLNPPAVPSF